MPLNRPRKPYVTTCFLYVNFYGQSEIVGLRKELNNFFLCKFDGVYFNVIVDQLQYNSHQMESNVHQVCTTGTDGDTQELRAEGRRGAER